MGIVKRFAEKLRRPPLGVHADKDATSFAYELDSNPNDFYEKFRTSGGVAEAAKEMERYDLKLFGLMQTRKLALLSLKREIVGDDQVADFVREVFSGLRGFHNTIYGLMSCVPCGFSVVEKVWEEQGGRFVYAKLKNWTQDRFSFKKETSGEYSLMLENGWAAKEAANGLKFTVLTHMPENNQPWGHALYQNVHWYWYMKRHGVKFWAISTERFGAPITHATIPDNEFSNPGSKVREVVESFIATVHKTSAPSIITPQGVEIVLKEANHAGALASYEGFIKFLDDSMAIAILGQTLSSNVSDSGGSYSLGKVHERVRMDILSADITMLETFVNDELIKPLVDFNFPDVGSYPKWRIVRPDTEDRKVLAEVISTLVGAGFDGVPMSWIHEKFGIPIPGEGEKVLVPPAPPLPAIGDGMTASEVVRQEQIRLYMEDLRKVK